MNINKQGSTVQRKHTKREEKVKLDKEAHTWSTPRRKAKRETRLLLGTKHVLDGNYVICPEYFRPWNIFWGGQILLKNSKNVDFDRIMKAFYDERNNTRMLSA